ncbi:MAG: YicC/YloC family endoribonuclease [Aestuariivirga sp.]
MALSSMTGFAQSSGEKAGLHWQWEIKSVNGKALDIRCRLPSGFEALEPIARSALAQHIKRGNLQVTLTTSGAATPEAVVVNEAVLEQVLAIAEKLRDRIGGVPLSAVSLMGLRGVLEVVQPTQTEAEVEARLADVASSLEKAAAALDAARRSEGARLSTVISAQLAKIESLVIAARDCPARSADVTRLRLHDQITRLLDTGADFDKDRLHQEAILIATRADIQEELDRLFAHLEAARVLLASPEPAGRKFDFLSQEFNREANTLCSKALDKTLTAIGLELKTVIDQMREQVQNIE